MRVFPILLLVAACSAKLSGQIDLDGKKFDIDSCRSGQALGFHGIQLADDPGTKIRLVSNADGSTNAIVFAPGADRGEDLGPCGTLEMHAQNSKINDVTNQEGVAKLSCKGAHAVEGTLQFENCH